MKVAIIAYIIFVLAAVAGWVMNLVEVIHLALAEAPLNVLFALRILGVPVGPVGAILGWF